MDALEFKRIDNLLKEVAGGLPYEEAREEFEVICDGERQVSSGVKTCESCHKCGENTCGNDTITYECYEE